jgi:ABC-type glycerol-3-phosphate transport system substrate-binding protein
MERKTFIKSGLSVAATAAIPAFRDTIPQALAHEARATETITWWSWGDPALNLKVTGTVANHNSPNDAPKVLYERSHPGITIDTTTYNYPDY